jgi:hypothetical protein
MFTRAICRSFISEGLVYFVFEDEAFISRSHKYVPEKVMLDGHGFLKGVSLSKQSEQGFYWEGVYMLSYPADHPTNTVITPEFSMEVIPIPAKAFPSAYTDPRNKRGSRKLE